MMRRIFGPLAALAMVVAVPDAANARAGHSHSHADHGGQVQKIGKYEGELVVKGGELTLYVNDENDKPANASGFAATAIVLAKDGQKTIDLKPAGENKLAGSGEFQPADGKIRATVTLTADGRELGKGRYNIDAAKR
jgi:hypothetical protein